MARAIFRVWTSPDTMGLVQARRAEKGGRFPMKKRIFAALLALVMLLGALPVTASAAGSPGYISDVTLGDNRYVDGVRLLS